MARTTPPGRREAILLAARQEFAQRGYAGTRLDDVADRVGISKAALYLQFADKQALFLAMIDQLLEATLPVAGSFEIPGSSSAERLAFVIRLAAGRIAGSEIAFVPRLVIGESGNFPEIARAWHDRALTRVLGLFAGEVAQGVADGEFREVDPALVAKTIAGGILVGALWRTVLEPAGVPGIDVAQLAQSHAEIIVRGLMAEPGEDNGDG
jgi:AcrR family transcriptional regulator